MAYYIHSPSCPLIVVDRSATHSTGDVVATSSENVDDNVAEAATGGGVDRATDSEAATGEGVSVEPSATTAEVVVNEKEEQQAASGW